MTSIEEQLIGSIPKDRLEQMVDWILRSTIYNLVYQKLDGEIKVEIQKYIHKNMKKICTKIVSHALFSTDSLRHSLECDINKAIKTAASDIVSKKIKIDMSII